MTTAERRKRLLVLVALAVGVFVLLVAIVEWSTRGFWGVVLAGLITGGALVVSAGYSLFETARAHRRQSAAHAPAE